MHDLTTGKSGLMTASKANGFGQIMFQPNSATCHERPYAFHPEYNDGRPARQHVGGARQQPRVRGRDRPLRVLQRDRRRGRQLHVSPPRRDTALDPDDIECFDGAASTLVQLTGCFGGAGDFDWDGTSLPARLAGHAGQPGAWTASCTRRRS